MTRPGDQPILDKMKLNNQQRRRLAQFISGDIPVAEINIAVNTEVNRRIAPLTSADSNNHFGSKWGEITAKMAAQNLGISISAALSQLTTPLPTKIKTEQGTVSALIKRRLREEISENGLDFAREQRLRGQENFWRLRAKELGCSTLQADKVVDCMSQILLTQDGFGKPVNLGSMLTAVARAANGKEHLILDVLRCPPQLDTLDRGITVCPEVNFKVKTAQGRVALVDQKANLSGVAPLIKACRSSEIPVATNITLVDIDAFVLEADNLETGVDEFEKRFKRIVEEILPGSGWRRVSQAISCQNRGGFLSDFTVKKILSDPRSAFSEKHVESVVNDIFERLQKRDLPPRLKTREASRELAKRKLALEFVMGKRLPLGNNTVLVQRASTTSAADTFLQGAKSEKRHPPFLFFWNERVQDEGGEE